MNETHRGIARSWTVLAVAALCALLPSGAAGQSTCPAASWDQAVRLIKTARRFAEAREYDKALAELRVAHVVCQDGKIQRAMGKVLEEARRLPEALDAYRTCAAEATEADTKAFCAQRFETLATSLSLGTLIVEAFPPQATVTVDGGPASFPAGRPMFLKVGIHRVDVRAAGRSPQARDVEVPATGELRIQVGLEVLPPPEVPRALGGTAAASPGPATSLEVEEPAARPSAAWNWVGVGAGTVVTGVGVAFLVQYGIDKSRARGAQYTSDGRLLADADTVGSRNVIVGSVLSAVGLAGVITAAVLWPKAPAKVSVGPLPGGGAIALEIPL